MGEYAINERALREGRRLLDNIDEGEFLPFIDWIDKHGTDLFDEAFGAILLRKTFEHIHVGPNEKCAKCGLDIRSRVHTRQAKAKGGSS